MMKFDTSNCVLRKSQPEFFKLHNYGAYIIQLYCMQKCIKIKSRKFSLKTQNNCRNNSPLKPYKITLRKTHINLYLQKLRNIYLSETKYVDTKRLERCCPIQTESTKIRITKSSHISMYEYNMNYSEIPAISDRSLLSR